MTSFRKKRFFIKIILNVLINKYTKHLSITNQFLGPKTMLIQPLKAAELMLLSLYSSFACAGVGIQKIIFEGAGIELWSSWFRDDSANHKSSTTISFPNRLSVQLWLILPCPIHLTVPLWKFSYQTSLGPQCTAIFIFLLKNAL